MKEQAVVIGEPDGVEELERAELYGLLARCWQAPPDPALLEQFAIAVTEAPQSGSFLEAPWQDLVAAMRASSIAQAGEEYTALFIATGRPEVFLYGSHYLSGSLNDKPLALLRQDLAAMGLGRDAANYETEDHVAYVLELMRYLIAGDDVVVCNLERQRLVFRAHLQPWLGAFCDAVQGHPQARLYASLAAFTRAFIEVETQAFDMIE
jgi:TorA maturation chaperone TorD